MHKKITSENHPIYDMSKSNNLFIYDGVNCRKLTMMKQRNIKEAIENNKFNVSDLRSAIDRRCGYCFKYFCGICPLHEKLEWKCFEITEWKLMVTARTKKTFRKYHKAWCKKIGLDVYKDED